MTDASKYSGRGVSSSKSEVHQAIKGLSKGLYPTAFCKILPDHVGQDEAYANVMHADTAGSKTSLAYLYWKETRDLNVWKGIAQDAIVMNLDDMACVGITEDIILSSTIGRNKNRVPGEVIKAIIEGATEFIELLASHGISVHQSGGETADVGDIVRTIDVGYTTFARIKRDQLMINDIQDGDHILGLASFGQTSYETSYNSGISSNGLTSARHDVLSAYYKKHFPESFDPMIPDELSYSGKRKLSEMVLIGQKNYKVSDLILSPTRTYMPALKMIFKEWGKHIHGIIHCTGGAQTKVLKFIEQKKIIKDHLFEAPPVFQLIQNDTATSTREMYQVFNMGHRLEIFAKKHILEEIQSLIKPLNIASQIIGRVENAEVNEVVIDTGSEQINYL